MRRARVGLLVLFCATLVGSLSALAASVSWQWEGDLLESHRWEPALSHATYWLGDASPALGAVAWIATAVALLLIVRAPEMETLRLRTLGVFAVTAMSSTFALRVIQTGEFRAGDAEHTLRLMLVFVAFGMVQSVCLLLLLGKIAAAAGKPLPAWVTVGVLAHAAWLLLGGLPHEQADELGWTRQVIYGVLDVPMLAAILLTWRARPELPEAAVTSATR